MNENLTLFLVFGAGVVSVFSPCVLPVLPVIVTGTEKESRYRPILLVAGLSIAFIAMGVLTALFASVIGSYMFYVEKVAGAVILLFGLLMLLDVNLFKHLTFFQNAKAITRGNKSAFLVGVTLGIIWIPCVGPVLSSVLAIVASKGSLVTGVLYLLLYSIGFSIPILIAAYASHFFRTRFKTMQKHPVMLRIVSATLLIVLGAIILFKGMIAFGGFGI